MWHYFSQVRLPEDALDFARFPTISREIVNTVLAAVRRAAVKLNNSSGPPGEQPVTLPCRYVVMCPLTAPEQTHFESILQNKGEAGAYFVFSCGCFWDCSEVTCS